MGSGNRESPPRPLRRQLLSELLFFPNSWTRTIRTYGRSRGGLTTKIHAVVDANGNAILLKLTEGQAHDGRSAADMLDSIGEGQILLADRAYDSDALRTAMTDRGAWANIKPMPRRVNSRVQPLALPLSQPGRALFSTSSSIPGRSQHASKSRTPTISRSSNSPHPEAGCGL